MNIRRSVTIACLALSVSSMANAVPLLCRDASDDRSHDATEWAECFNVARGRIMSSKPVGNGGGLRITGIDSTALLSGPGAAPLSSLSSSGGNSVSAPGSTGPWSGIGSGSNPITVQPSHPLPPVGPGQPIDIPKHVDLPTHAPPIGTPPAKNVPEPGTLALLGFALVGSACARRRKPS